MICVWVTEGTVKWLSALAVYRAHVLRASKRTTRAKAHEGDDCLIPNADHSVSLTANRSVASSSSSANRLAVVKPSGLDSSACTRSERHHYRLLYLQSPDWPL
jgi:hypothetical protein